MPKDSHRRHQQLMQKLDILNGRIRAQESYMARRRDRESGEDWEKMVRRLKKLNEEKARLNREISRLED